MKNIKEQQKEIDDHMYDHEAIHLWFSLTYANYLVLPRVALQSMDNKWQKKFVLLLNEMEESLPEYNELQPDKYQVNCKNYNGKFVADKFPHYQRGRAKLKNKNNCE